jgi:DnaJ-class molecular chaperone
MQPQPRHSLAPNTTMRTLCPNCYGAGHIVSDRATHSKNLDLPAGFQMHPCPTCEGQRWLAGFQPPV